MSAFETLARGVVMAGIPGPRPPKKLPRFGGYVLFARNGTAVEAVRSLTDELRAAYVDEPPPLIAIDQEGGRVARLTQGVETMPPAMTFGAAGDLDLVRRAGEQIAFDLRRAGCSMDFAPVVDLALDPGNTVIGTRSFGSNPQRVAELAIAFARGMESGGVFPCFKHFPGHGATAHDSHSGAAVVRASARTLRARDLVPFAAAAKTARAVMGGHLLVEAFDEAAPATQSKVLIELLRGELGFDGAYVTDCLHMAAAGGDPVDAAVAAFRAGADLLLVSHSIDLANEAVRRISLAAQSGDLPAGRLREAHDRVTRLRAGARAPRALSAPPLHRGLGREAARRGVTLVRGIPHADPTSAIAISFEGTTVEGAAGEHTVHPSLRHESAALEHLELPLEPAENDVAAALAALARTTRRAIVLTRRANVHLAQAAAVARIVAQDPDAVVVSMREPFDVPLFGAARHVLAAYGDDAASVGGLADVLFGGSAPEGTLPVEIPGA